MAKILAETNEKDLLNERNQSIEKKAYELLDQLHDLRLIKNKTDIAKVVKKVINLPDTLALESRNIDSQALSDDLIKHFIAITVLKGRGDVSYITAMDLEDLSSTVPYIYGVPIGGEEVYNKMAKRIEELYTENTDNNKRLSLDDAIKFTELYNLVANDESKSKEFSAKVAMQYIKDQLKQSDKSKTVSQLAQDLVGIMSSYQGISSNFQQNQQDQQTKKELNDLKKISQIFVRKVLVSEGYKLGWLDRAKDWLQNFVDAIKLSKQPKKKYHILFNALQDSKKNNRVVSSKPLSKDSPELPQKFNGATNKQKKIRALIENNSEIVQKLRTAKTVGEARGGTRFSKTDKNMNSR